MRRHDAVAFGRRRHRQRVRHVGAVADKAERHVRLLVPLAGGRAGVGRRRAEVEDAVVDGALHLLVGRRGRGPERAPVGRIRLRAAVIVQTHRKRGFAVHLDQLRVLSHQLLDRRVGQQRQHRRQRPQRRQKTRPPSKGVPDHHKGSQRAPAGPVVEVEVLQLAGRAPEVQPLHLAEAGRQHQRDRAFVDGAERGNGGVDGEAEIPRLDPAPVGAGQDADNGGNAQEARADREQLKEPPGTRQVRPEAPPTSRALRWTRRIRRHIGKQFLAFRPDTAFLDIHDKHDGV